MSFHVLNDKLIKIYEPEEIIEAVTNTVNYYKNRADKLATKNKELHDHAIEMANEELIDTIQALREQLDMSYGFFSSQKEKDAYKDFEQRHMHERLTMKSQGGKAPYLIPTGVGVGTHLEVVCPICGEKENITDTSVW